MQKNDAKCCQIKSNYKRGILLWVGENPCVGIGMLLKIKLQVCFTATKNNTVIQQMWWSCC